jgi:predicted ATPase
VTQWRGRCLSYGGGTPYLPLLDVLRQHCGITDLDDQGTVAGRVRERLRQAGLDPDAAAPHLLPLLGLRDGAPPLSAQAGETTKARTFEIMRQMMLATSRDRTLILSIEGLQWIDRTSEEFLSTLVERLPGVPIMLVTTYRPGYRPPWLERSYATQIALSALSPADSEALLRTLVPAGELSDALAKDILARAEGNPFFLEELSLLLAEPGQPASTARIPGTVHEAVLARIHRLPEPARRVLQTASVLGRKAPRRILREIWEGDGELLASALLELVRQEFLSERSEAGDAVYVFRHALTQEVAYESILPARRQLLHAAVARVLAGLRAARPGDVTDVLAYHQARARQTD